MAILLTGGAGFIGSHTAVTLLEEGKEIVVADNFSNSDQNVLDNIRKISKKDFKCYKIDIRNKKELSKIFIENNIDATIHFAGFKSVSESIKDPIMYYANNIDATLSLINVMKEYECKKIIFSSSATVYGERNISPLTESMEVGKGISNPYGMSKYMIEQILKDLYFSDNEWSIVILRYFNPVGAHKSGIIGERPTGIPNNLMPYITQVAAGIREKLTVFGGDYSTQDGSCVRDFIHVMDLAEGHLAACNFAENNKGIEAINLGTGTGISVLKLVDVFSRVNDIDVPYIIGDRRIGDIPEVYADASKSKRILNWEAKRTVEDMCRDSWRWECSYNNRINSPFTQP